MKPILLKAKWSKFGYYNFESKAYSGSIVFINSTDRAVLEVVGKKKRLHSVEVSLKDLKGYRELKRITTITQMSCGFTPIFKLEGNVNNFEFCSTVLIEIFGRVPKYIYFKLKYKTKPKTKSK